jgi:hypothetical protein
MKKIVHASLCSGIGAAELADTWLGDEFIKEKLKMSGFFDDIDRAWKDKSVEFVYGKHKGKIGTCAGFYNIHNGAGLMIICDSGEKIMVYSRNLDEIKIIKR